MTRDASLWVSSPRKIPTTTNMTPRPQPITAELLGVEQVLVHICECTPCHPQRQWNMHQCTGQETTDQFRYAAALLNSDKLLSDMCKCNTQQLQILVLAGHIPFRLLVFWMSLSSLPSPRTTTVPRNHGLTVSTLICSIWGLKWDSLS